MSSLCEGLKHNLLRIIPPRKTLTKHLQTKISFFGHRLSAKKAVFSLTISTDMLRSNNKLFCLSTLSPKIPIFWFKVALRIRSRLPDLFSRMPTSSKLAKSLPLIRHPFRVSHRVANEMNPFSGCSSRVAEDSTRSRKISTRNSDTKLPV